MWKSTALLSGLCVPVSEKLINKEINDYMKNTGETLSTFSIIMAVTNLNLVKTWSSFDFLLYFYFSIFLIIYHAHLVEHAQRTASWRAGRYSKTVSAEPYSGLSNWKVPSCGMALGTVTDIGLIGRAAARYRRNMHIFLTLCQGHRNLIQSCIDGGRDTDTKWIDTHLHWEAQVTQGDCRWYMHTALAKRNGKRCTCECLKVTLTQVYSVMYSMTKSQMNSDVLRLKSCWTCDVDILLNRRWR